MNARWFAAALVAPAAALLLGVWAEFAELGPPLLLAVAVPAIAAWAACVAYITGRWTRPAFIVSLGALIGTLTFGLTEGSYLALHFSRGGEVDFEGLDSQRAMAAALLGIHLGVGALVGLGVGVGLALLLFAGRVLGPRPFRVT